MSYLDDYRKAKKKLEEAQEEQSGSFMDRYRKAKTQLNEVQKDDIAPVRTDVVPVQTFVDDEGKKEKWYEGYLRLGDALSDGWQFGDVAKTLLGTDTDILTNSISGVVGWGEDAIDAGATAIGTLAEKVGWDEAAQKLRDFVKQELYDESETARKILKGGSVIAPLLPPGLNNVAQAASGIIRIDDWLNSKEVDDGFGGTMTVRADNSVLGDQADSLIQSVGEVIAKKGLQAAAGGIPIADIITGVTVYGEQAEQALREDATFGEATGSGLISAAAEIMFEKLSGGVKFGGVTLDEGLTRLVSKNISNVALKNLAHLALSIPGESLEELATEFVSKLGTSLYKEEDLADILFSEESLNDYIRASFAGGLMGGSFSGYDAVTSTAKGRDAKTGLSENEQKVVDKVYKDLVAEEAKKSKDGKVSQAKKNELYDQAVAAMDKGYIDTDTIEEVLGGEDFEAYRAAQDKENAVLKELESLYQGEELAAQQQGIRDHSTLSQLRQAMGEKVSGLVKRDRLAESYRERERRTQLFQADLSQYQGKGREIVQKAIDSGVLNNTNRSHELVDLIAKVGADKALDFDFTNNEKLKESGFALDGKTVNGFLSDSGVTVNINSAKALNSVVGHEITHVLEGTGEFYTALESMVTEYAKSKGEYNARLTELRSLYADVDGYKGADGHEKIKKELVADLVGDYIFTDTEFIKRLSTENRNLFEKIYDELKYLCRVATAGSKEARQLEKAKKAFEDAYRQDAKNTADDGGVRYSIGKTSKMPYANQLELIENGKMNGSNSLYVSKPSQQLQAIALSNAPFAMNQSDYRKSRRAAGRNKNYSAHAVPFSFFEEMPQYLADAPMVIDNGGKATVITPYEMNDTKGNTSYVIAGVLKDQTMESDTVNLIKSVYPLDDIAQRITRAAEDGKLVVANKNKAEQMLATIGIQPSEVSRIINLAKRSVAQQGQDVNMKFSLSSQEDMFPVRKDLDAVRGNIYGSDVELQEAFPVRQDLQTEEAEQDPYDDLPFDMPENLEEGQLSDAELEEDARRDPITTVAERLEVKFASLRQELQTNEQNRKASADAYDQRIAELQQRYDAKPKKHTKAANAILRQIAKQEQLKAQRDAEFEKRINDIKKKIDKTREQMQMDHTREDLLEKQLRQVDEKLEADKQALEEEFRERRAEAERVADRASYFSSEARILLDEIIYHKKGTGFSEDIRELLGHGHSFKEIKDALRTVEQYPDGMRYRDSIAEQNVRMILERNYENAVYEADELETDYQRRLKTLNDDAEAMRTAVRKASEGITRKQLHSKIMENIRTEFTNRGYDLDKVLKNVKDLATFTTVDSTPQRVMERALGYKEGGVLADLTVNKVAQNETEGIKWLNSFTDRKNGVLAQLSKKYGIKPGSKESAAAQMYAEGFFVNEKDEIVRYGDPELLQDFPDQKVRENIKGLARDPLIRQIYDQTLDSLNESRRRNAYPEIQKLDNYFLHFRAMDDTFSKLGLPFNPNDIRAKDLPTDLNGVTADLKPGQPYFSSAMHRKGKRTSFDLLGGLERYLTSAKNQIYHIDDIQTLRALRNYIADIYGQADGLEDLDYLGEEEAQELLKQKYSNHLSTFAKFLNEEANIIAGKTSLIDRGLEGIIGRRGITFLNDLNKQVGSNMVGYNLSSAGTNVIPVIQAFAKSNKYDFVKAIAQTAYYRIGKLAKIDDDGFRENSPVVIRRKGADSFYRTPWQKISDPGYAIMGAVDDVSTEVIARAKYNEFIRKGMDPQKAHFETDKWVSRLMGDRSLGQMPHLYNSKMLGLITKFQLEVRNQLDSQVYDTIQEEKTSAEQVQNRLERNAKITARVASAFVQLAALQHLFGWAYESFAGYNPTFDIVEALIKTLGFDDEEDSEDTILDNVEQGFLTLMEDMPYTSAFMDGGRIPISSALPIGQLIKGEDQYGNEKPRLETLLEALPYYLMPGGYGQTKKTIKGISMYLGDKPTSGSYTASGNLRFPVAETPLSIAQAAVFGQWANENARTYIEEGRSPIPESQIQDFMDSGLTYEAWWERKDELKKVDNDFEANEPIMAFRQVLDQVEDTAAELFPKDEDLLKEKFMRSAADELSDIKAEMKELVTMPLAEIYKERNMQTLQAKANEIAQSAMDAYSKVEFDGDYARVGEKVWKRDEDGDWRRLTGEALTKYQVTSASESDVYATDGTNHYRWYEPGEDAENPEPGWRKVSKKELERQNAVTSALGITPEEYWGDRREEYSYAYENPEKYLVIKATGGYEKYTAYKKEINKLESDKDKDGKTISGSKKNKVIKYINSLDAAYGEKLVLFKSLYPADDTYNEKIVQYLNSRKDLTVAEIKAILKELDFTVQADGTVTW